jgi:tetratricopeptide (TPR) repeat protein
MFFPKLRRRAKWVFAFLALAFGLAFVVAGVGSGFGSGLGDYLSDLFNTQPGTDQPSVESAREAVRKNPQNAEAQKDLATALQAENDVDGAIAAMEAYVELRPNDVDGLQQLAGLYTVKAGEAEALARNAQIIGASAFFSSELFDPSSPLAQTLTGDPITQFRQQQATSAFQEASVAAQAAYAKEVELWTKLTALRPDEANFQAQLARAAEQAGNTATAITAYERFLELSPDAPQAEQIRERIEQLKAAETPPAAGGG